MNLLKKTSLMLLAFTLFIVSCKKDDKAPTISHIEIGHDNDKIAHIGHDLHFEAEISAPGNIQTMQVSIRSKNNSSNWKFDQFYTEFTGQKNAHLHKHIDIPSDAAPGAYLLSFIVIDQNGKITKSETEIQLKEETENELYISELDVHIEDGGNTLHVTAHVTASHKIAKIVVEIHGSHEDEFTFTDMQGEDYHHFNEHIDFSNFPAGHYDLHFSVTDLDGNETDTEVHFDK